MRNQTLVFTFKSILSVKVLVRRKLQTVLYALQEYSFFLIGEPKCRFSVFLLENVNVECPSPSWS